MRGLKASLFSFLIGIALVVSLAAQLSPGDLREMDAALAHLAVHGGRMNAEQMKVVDQSV